MENKVFSYYIMPRSRTRKRGRRKRSGVVGLVPKTLRKAITKVNKAARSAARGVDSIALIKAPKIVLGPILKRRFGGRKFPGLSGGYMSKAVRQLRNPGVYGVVKTAKKGGRKRRRGGATGKKKKRPWGMSDVILGAVAAPVEGVRLALGKGGWKRRRGGRKTRRGGRKSRR